MENNRPETGRWVDEHLAALDSSADWQPNTARALAALQWRRRIRRAGWISATAATLAAGLVLLTVSGPRACANPMECSNDAPQSGSQKMPARNFKLAGSPAAPVTVEIYSDYQCPSCALAFTSTVPDFVKTYVNTGKVKLLHRDYPLPQHPYARLAARYANAAGRAGYYEAAVEQIFKTQGIWETNGAIDQQLAAVLPADVLQKVRQAAQSDASLDQTVIADLTQGARDGINQTPSTVVVDKGKRQVIPGVPAMPLLKSYIDDLLK